VLNKNNKQYEPLKFNLFVYIIYFFNYIIFNYNLLFNKMKDISLSHFLYPQNLILHKKNNSITLFFEILYILEIYTEYVLSKY